MTKGHQLTPIELNVFVPYLTHQCHLDNVRMKQTMRAVVSKTADMCSMKGSRTAVNCHVVNCYVNGTVHPSDSSHATSASS